MHPEHAAALHAGNILQYLLYGEFSHNPSGCIRFGITDFILFDVSLGVT
jgi:hypothetical protein